MSMDQLIKDSNEEDSPLPKYAYKLEEIPRVFIVDGTMRTEDSISEAVRLSADRVASKAFTLANILQDKLDPIMGPRDSDATDKAELEWYRLRLKREPYPLLFASIQESIDGIETALTNIELCLRRTELP